jgi:hypothetical protein
MIPPTMTDGALVRWRRLIYSDDEPLKDLRFRCTKCGSHSDSVVMAKPRHATPR